MFSHFLDRTVDHGLPLIRLKEQRRDLVISLIGLTGRLDEKTIREIAAVQQTIAAIEAVVIDLDAELAALDVGYASAIETRRNVMKIVAVHAAV
jgi:hypothetical protein